MQLMHLGTVINIQQILFRYFLININININIKIWLNGAYVRVARTKGPLHQLLFQTSVKKNPINFSNFGVFKWIINWLIAQKVGIDTLFLAFFLSSFHNFTI